MSGLVGRSRLFLVALTLLTADASAQDPPALTRSQRDVLQAVVAAVDAAASQPATPGLDWLVHLLRASDGSHYVATSIASPPDLGPEPVILYVRLASRHPERSVAAERSAVMEWLKGMRSDPLPMRATRVVRVPTGELPVGGPSSMVSAGGGRDGVAAAGQATAALALMERDRERAKQEREEQERQRKAELEGKGEPARNALFPFEDFDAAAAATAGTVRTLERALTAGPGEYDLYVAWAAPVARGAPQPKVLKRTLTLPPAPIDEFTLSSVILADDVKTGVAPYAANRQTAHPYSIGATAVVPARDAVFTNDERLSVVVQVVNPLASPAGKPDVAIGFRLFQKSGDSETPFATLNPQYYNETTLPVDFDLKLGHPIFAAMSAPLTKLPRGTFRLNVTATDRHSRRVVSADTTFSVVATVESLLRTAPPAVPAFHREALLDAAITGAVVSRLTPSAAASPALARALAAAREQRFVDVLREDGYTADEQAAGAVLRGMALYALGDSSRAIAVHFRRALELNAPPGTAQVFLGACQAMDGFDRSAIADWESALDTGFPKPPLAPLLVDAHLRAGNAAAAAALADAALRDRPDDRSLVRGRAAAHLAQGRPGEALSLLAPAGASPPEDPDAHYIVLRALFDSVARKTATPADASRFATLAQAYIDRKGPHAAAVEEWMKVTR